MIKNIFFVIGVLSSIFTVLASIFLLYEFSREKNTDEAQCMDGTTMFLGTRYFNNHYYEVIYQISGFSDKAHFISLYKDTRPSNKSCIAYDKIISSDSIYFGEEHGPETQWPVEIRIENEKLNIKYTQNKDNAIPTVNIAPVWSE